MKPASTLWVEPYVLSAKAKELLAEKATIVSLLDRLKNECDPITPVFGLSAMDAAVQYKIQREQICNNIIYMLGYVSEYANAMEDIAFCHRREPEDGQSSALKDILNNSTNVFR